MTLILKKINPDGGSDQARAMKWRLEELCRKESLIGEVKWQMETFIKYYPRKNSFCMSNLYYLKLIEQPLRIEIWKRRMTAGLPDVKMYEVHKS